MLKKLARLFSPASKAGPDPDVSRVVAAVDPRIGALADHAEHLGPAIRHARRHFARVAGEIPGPITVSARRHGRDPALGVLFPSVGDIVQGIGRSMELREAMKRADPGADHVHALLGVRRKSRPDRGGRGDESGATHHLSDHTFRSLGPTEQHAREALGEAAFSSLVRSFSTGVVGMHRQHRLASSENELNREILSRMGGSGGEALENHLAEAARSLEPRQIMVDLVACLQNPERHLRLDAGNGHRVDSDGQAGIHLPLLSGTDRRDWLVCVARLPMDEVRMAMEAEPRAHRFIMI